MFKPVEVRSLENYKIWVKYSDGVQGEVDLSRLVGKGVFSLWNDYSKFRKVNIKNGAITWNEQVDLCPDSVYLELTNQTPEEVFPKLKHQNVDA